MAVCLVFTRAGSYFFVRSMPQGGGVVHDRGRVFASAGEFLFVRDKKEPKSASADGCPAELTSRLKRYVQTAAGNMKDFHERGATLARAAYAFRLHTEEKMKWGDLYE